MQLLKFTWCYPAGGIKACGQNFQWSITWVLLSLYRLLISYCMQVWAIVHVTPPHDLPPLTCCTWSSHEPTTSNQSPIKRVHGHSWLRRAWCWGKLWLSFDQLMCRGYLGWPDGVVMGSGHMALWTLHCDIFMENVLLGVHGRNRVQSEKGSWFNRKRVSLAHHKQLCLSQGAEPVSVA